jgi:multisubunit Na+/H+ antiporter MnhC subunit
MTVPCIILTLFLYVLLGAWLVLMIVRNLKRDLPQIQLLSRWQCVGLMGFWNLLFYAFLDTKVFLRNPSPLHSELYAYRAYEIAMMAVMWNSVFLFLIGLASLSPHEKLKTWWRRWKSGDGSYFAPDGLPWPWLVPAAIIGYGMLAAEAFGLRSTVPLAEWRLGFAALASGAFLVFTARDVIFLQWCLLTRMKHPVMKGILFLVLYNTAVGLVGAVITMISSATTPRVLALLTPYVLLGGGEKPPSPPAFILSAIVVQGGICALFLYAIQGRLSRPVQPAVGIAV